MFAGTLLFFRPARTRRGWAIGGAILVAWVGLSVWLLLSWTKQKRAFDESDLPPGWIRVSQYQTGPLGDDQTRPAQVDKVTRYVDFVRGEDGEKVRHLIVRGGRAEDRSDLVVALGTEWAARVKPVRYVTAPRLLEHPDDIQDWAKEKQAAAAAVVVDDLIDLVPGEPTPERSPGYRAEVARLATKGPRPTPRAPLPAGLKPGEVRPLSTLRNLEAFRREAGYKVSTVWAVGGSPARVAQLVQELRLILEGPDQEIEEVVLGPEPPLSAAEPPAPPRGLKRAGHSR
jgi:hypothetical protein